MLTNLLASAVITLITNVITTDNAVMEPDFSRAYTVFPPQYAQRIQVPATERYLTTNVLERTVLTVTLPSGPQTFSVDRQVSSVTGVFKRREDWKPLELRTNMPPVSGIFQNDVFGEGRLMWGYQLNSVKP